MKEESESYRRGFRNGHCDRILNIPPMDVAIYSRDKEYADGYRDGYSTKNFLKSDEED